MAEDGLSDSQRMQDRATVYIDIKRTLLTSDLVSDAEGDALHVNWVGPASIPGTQLLLDSQNGRIALTLPHHYNGPLKFDYSVSDGKGGITKQTANVIVNAVDDAPHIKEERLSKSIEVSGKGWSSWRLNVVDVDSDVSLYNYSTDKNPKWGAAPQFSKSIASSTYFDGESGYWTVGSLIAAPKNYFVLNEQPGGRSGGKTTIGFKLAHASGYVGYYEPAAYSYTWDPIAIDLGSDGLEFSTAKYGVNTFDADGDGINERLAWVKGNDALLAYDYNSDNLVTRFDELAFGSHLASPDPDMPDLQALAHKEFDANQDGLLDAADDKWVKFKIWHDKNTNGVVDAGELQSMAQAGVQSIALHANVLNHAYNDDVTIRGFTRVRMTDGRELQAGDARFGAYDPSTDTPTPTTGTPSTVKALSETDYNAELADWMRSHDALMHAGSTHFSGGLSAQKTWINAEYRYAISSTLFDHLPPNQRYVVTQSDGSALPSWLHYDSKTRTLSGTPGPFHQGLLKLLVSVPGQSGTLPLGSGIFALEVAEYNQAPVLYGGIGMQLAREGLHFTFDVAPNLFIDRDGTDKLSFKATQADGSDLPSWLNFDPVLLRFSGTPMSDAVGDWKFKLVAQDNAQASAQDHFSIYVEGINHAPELAKPLLPFCLRVGQPNAYTIPLDAFVDPDKGDNLSLSVSMADGRAMPSWLGFDPMSRSLSGTPTGDNLQDLQILRITATDQAGEGISTWLSMITNNRPTGSVTISGAAIEGQALTVSHSLVDADGLGSIHWQWLSDGKAIEGANGNTLTLSPAQVAKSINVLASYTDGFGSVETVSSAMTTLVSSMGPTDGNDLLVGHAGVNTLIGGAGSDTFLFNSASESTDAPMIMDFSKSQGDAIALDDAAFNHLTGLSSLLANFRWSSQAPSGGDDFIVYDASTGSLFYDASGNGTGAPHMFATLANKPQDLTAGQFVVI